MKRDRKMNDNELREKWMPILKPIWKETEGFSMEQWEAWTKDDQNKEKVTQIVMASLELFARSSVLVFPRVGLDKERY